MAYKTLKYSVAGRIARITLNRPARLNAIDDKMPREIRRAVEAADKAYENMGLASTQMMATLFDGITRHSPEGVWFKKYAEKHGFHAAVKWRDSGKAIP